MLKITYITCEHQNCPLAIETQHPRFSWELESDEANTVQTAYQILVRDWDERTIWDSGRIESNQTYEITYEGNELESAKRYTYRVQIWDNHGNTAIGEIQRFETAYFQKSDWKARWIEPNPLPQLSENPLPKAQAIWNECLMAMMRGEQPKYYVDGDIWDTLPTEPYDPPVRFRRTFDLEEKPEYAKVFMTAHGIYNLSVNGQKVPGTLLAPGFTTYEKRLKYQAYDITNFLKEGENAISVTVADGWYKGKIALGKGCEYGEVPGLLMQMEIWNADGRSIQICSDEAFTYSFDGPIRYADLFTGECIDARKYDGDPSEVSYQAEKWKSVKNVRYDLEILTAQNAPEIEIYEELPAKEILITSKGETVIDFGQNMAGMIRVEITAKEGEEISFEHGETLDAEGNFTYAFTDTTRAQKDVYISAGKEGEVFEPEFTYHGFRYVKVTGGESWKPEQFTAKAISSANAVTGSFQCSDEKLNQLQHNIYWSQRSNTIGTPTDCPTREKAGWTGDVVVYGATALYNQEMTSFFEDWLESIRQEQNEAGHVLNTVPLIKNYVQQTMAGSLGWGDVILTLPLQLYHLFGDKQALEENYEAMEKWMKAMQKAADELPQQAMFDTKTVMNPESAENAESNSVEAERKMAEEKVSEKRHQENLHYLINTGFHFGDWLVPSVKNDAGFSDGPASSFLTMNVVDTALLAANADMLAEISTVLQKKEKAEKYKNYAKRVREAFYEELCVDGRLKQEMQGNYILALKHHMIPKEMEEEFAKRLAEMIIANDNKPDTGFMSVAHILDILCDYGYRELAWKVLNQNGCPGWIYEVEHGATTMWENWDAIRPDGQVDGCSFNHYAFGCVGDFLYRRVLGIQNAGIGYDKIRLEPGYDFSLEWAEGTYHSVHGDIRLRWEKEPTGVCIKGSIPVNTEAILVLPDGSEKKLESGVFSRKERME